MAQYILFQYIIIECTPPLPTPAFSLVWDCSSKEYKYLTKKWLPRSKTTILKNSSCVCVCWGVERVEGEVEILLRRIFFPGGDNLRSDFEKLEPFSKLKTAFCKYWTPIKIKISMTYLSKKYETKTKMVQEQWIQQKKKFLWVIIWKFPKHVLVLKQPFHFLDNTFKRAALK